MKYVLTIIPFSQEGKQGAATALCIAKRIGATVLLMNKLETGMPVKTMAASGGGIDFCLEQEAYHPEDFIRMLKSDESAAEEPVIACVSEKDFFPNSGKINAEEIGLIITHKENAVVPGLNMDVRSDVIMAAKCPILKISSDKSLTAIRKLGYVTDIRYCDMAILKPLVEFCRPFNTELLLIHVTASGLPDIENTYAEKLFATEIVPMMNYKNAILINLLGNDIVADIQNVAEVMMPDVIALSNRKYWFYDRLFPSGTEQRRTYADIPLLLFS